MSNSLKQRDVELYFRTGDHFIKCGERAIRHNPNVPASHVVMYMRQELEKDKLLVLAHQFRLPSETNDNGKDPVTYTLGQCLWWLFVLTVSACAIAWVAMK